MKKKKIIVLIKYTYIVLPISNMDTYNKPYA